MRITFFLLLGLALSSAATSWSWATPAQVLLIRHAEKPPIGNELSERGWQRARALVDYFEHVPAVTRYGTPAAIYAMNPGSATGSVRAIQTLTPLAQALGLSIRSRYVRADFAPMVEEILSDPAFDGKMVLICWEHKVIPDIVARFGVSPRPADWPGDVFDQVMEVDFAEGHVTGFSRFSEQLLPGDSKNGGLQ